ncbi:MAG: NUDIX domain-containing protein [Pseudomonadota bacterium]
MGEIPVRSYTISVFVVSNSVEQPKVLLLRRADTLAGVWCQVAGKVEGDETAIHAALRELREETGLVPEAFYSADICEQFYEIDNNVIAIVPVFVGFVSEDARVQLNEEHDAYQWVSFEDAHEIVSFSGQRRILTAIKEEFVDKKPNELLRITHLAD